MILHNLEEVGEIEPNSWAGFNITLDNNNKTLLPGSFGVSIIDLWLLIVRLTCNLTYHVLFNRNVLFVHNGDMHSSVSVGYAANIKETYEKHETVVEAHSVHQVQLGYLWRSSAAWNAARIYQILLLQTQMGKLCKRVTIT